MSKRKPSVAVDDKQPTLSFAKKPKIEKVEERVEEKVEEKVEEGVEEKIQEKVQEKIQEKIQEKVQEKVQEKIEATEEAVDFPKTNEGGYGDILNYLTDPGWRKALKSEFEKPYFKEIISFLKTEEKSETIYPPPQDVFTAFNLTPLSQVRAVILGQDPYFNEGQAHGLCFSVRKGVKVPPSLNRIYKEILATYSDFEIPKHGNLEDWAKDGVFMINATMTVRKGKPNSHEKCGWQIFTDRVIEILNQERSNLVFLLWGGFAQKKAKLINKSKHDCVLSPHPSPMTGAAWNNCGCFKKANEILKKKGIKEIDWCIKK